MRGYCARCQEYRSDAGEDAWSIIWKQGNPTCERCGRFIDVNYFVEIGNRKSNKKQKICSNDGRLNKFPEVTRLIDNLRRIHVLYA